MDATKKAVHDGQEIRVTWVIIIACFQHPSAKQTPMIAHNCALHKNMFKDLVVDILRDKTCNQHHEIIFKHKTCERYHKPGYFKLSSVLRLHLIMILSYTLTLTLSHVDVTLVSETVICYSSGPCFRPEKLCTQCWLGPGHET